MNDPKTTMLLKHLQTSCNDTKEMLGVLLTALTTIMGLSDMDDNDIETIIDVMRDGIDVVRTIAKEEGI